MAAADALDGANSDQVIAAPIRERIALIALANTLAVLTGLAMVLRCAADHEAPRFARDLALGGAALGVLLVFICALGFNSVQPYAMFAFAFGDISAEWHRRSSRPVASLVVGAWIVSTGVVAQMACSRRHALPRRASASNVATPLRSFTRAPAQIVVASAIGGVAAGVLSAAIFLDGSEAISPGWIALGLFGCAGLLLLVRQARHK